MCIRSVKSTYLEAPQLLRALGGAQPGQGGPGVAGTRADEHTGTLCKCLLPRQPLSLFPFLNKNISVLPDSEFLEHHSFPGSWLHP